MSLTKFCKITFYIKSCRVFQLCQAGNTFKIALEYLTNSVFTNDRVEHLASVIQNFSMGEVLDPWSFSPEICPEEEETPDPVSMSEDVLRYMEMTKPTEPNLADAKFGKTDPDHTLATNPGSLVPIQGAANNSDATSESS